MNSVEKGIVGIVICIMIYTMINNWNLEKTLKYRRLLLFLKETHTIKWQTAGLVLDEIEFLHSEYIDALTKYIRGI
jgi:hypothetical protein